MTKTKDSKMEISSPNYSEVAENKAETPKIPDLVRRIAMVDYHGIQCSPFSYNIVYFVVERSQVETPCFSSTRKRAANFEKHFAGNVRQYQQALRTLALDTQNDGPSSLAQFIVLDTELVAAIARARVLQAKMPGTEFVIGVADTNYLEKYSHFSIKIMYGMMGLRKDYRSSDIRVDSRSIVWSHLPNASIKCIMLWKNLRSMMIAQKVFFPLCQDWSHRLENLNSGELVGKWVRDKILMTATWKRQVRPATLFLLLWEQFGLHPQDDVTKKLVYTLFSISLDMSESEFNTTTIIRETVKEELDKMLLMDQALHVTRTGQCAPRTEGESFKLQSAERFHMAHFHVICSAFCHQSPFELGRYKKRTRKDKHRIRRNPYQGTFLHSVLESDEENMEALESLQGQSREGSDSGREGWCTPHEHEEDLIAATYVKTEMEAENDQEIGDSIVGGETVLS